MNKAVSDRNRRLSHVLELQIQRRAVIREKRNCIANILDLVSSNGQILHEGSLPVTRPQPRQFGKRRLPGPSLCASALLRRP